MLDATPLGLLARRRPDPADLRRLDDLLAARVPIILPEIADYEVRRSLLLHGLQASIDALDVLKATLIYGPITTATMLRAASMWADARRRGQPTADPKELDGDVILAAQAEEHHALVATQNVGHLSRYVAVADWRRIVPLAP